MQPGIRHRVEAGARWLEGHGAEGWAERISANADFNMNDACGCAVGTTLGFFYSYFQPVDPDRAGQSDYVSSGPEEAELVETNTYTDAVALGFAVAQPEDERQDDAAWVELEHAWKELAAERLGVEA